MNAATDTPPAATPSHRADLRGPIFWVALAFAAFQLWMAAFHSLSSQVIRAMHVGFVLWLVFLLYPPFRQHPGWLGRAGRALGWGLGLAGLGTGLYQWVFEADLTQRAGELAGWDWWVGIVAIALVFEAARRVMGWGLPIICAVFLAYGAFGQHLPGALAHRGYDWEILIATLGFGTEGIYGTPTYVSSTYIFLFILFGAFLEQAGMVRLFTDFAMGTVGHSRGGPAKVAVISSGLMGTINGSGVANVVTTGQFTIPLMKKFGYTPAFAGAVEATSSMGGQIMPPVMGAVAFIMAETINVPYVEIAKAAAIPAMLYFFTVFWMVHLEAGRAGLKGLPKEECPDPWVAIRARWYLLLPLAGLVYLLFAGFTPMFAGMVGLALTVVLLFGSSLARHLNGTSLRLLFWIVLGLACSAFAKVGIISVVAVVAVLAVLLAPRADGRDTLRLAVKALVDGALHALPVGVACALVGVIIGVLTLAAGATAFAGYIIQIGDDSLFVSLLLTMLTCLVLGMGIPTIPNYIITSSIAAPALLELGVPLIVSHMFVFYFGIMADLTPPVALAAFAAAPIAKETGLKIGVRAVQIAIAGFIVPYMAVYAPELMLQGDKGFDATLYVVFKALLAVTLWGTAVVGYFRSPMNPLERVLAFVAASMLVVALPITDELGFGLAAVVMGWHIWRSRGAQALTV